jgi:hypothetical protein
MEALSLLFDYLAHRILTEAPLLPEICREAASFNGRRSHKIVVRPPARSTSTAARWELV